MIRKLNIQQDRKQLSFFYTMACDRCKNTVAYVTEREKILLKTANIHFVCSKCDNVFKKYFRGIKCREAITIKRTNDYVASMLPRTYFCEDAWCMYTLKNVYTFIYNIISKNYCSIKCKKHDKYTNSIKVNIDLLEDVYIEGANKFRALSEIENTIKELRKLGYEL